MLLTSMDIEAADEPDFNRWYDREHLEERVAIPGFVEARRYVAHAASPKYLCLYSTTNIGVLDSPAYRARLSDPTPWSVKTMARFKNMIRVVARVTLSKGTGRGAALGLVRLRPSGDIARWHDALRQTLVPEELAGIVSMHLLESDPELSGPTAEIPSVADSAAKDWFVLIDGTNVGAVSAVIADFFTGPAASPSFLPTAVGVYALMWDLAKTDLGTR